MCKRQNDEQEQQTCTPIWKTSVWTSYQSFLLVFLPVYQNSSTKNTKIVWTETQLFSPGADASHVNMHALKACWIQAVLVLELFANFTDGADVHWDLRGNFGRYVGCPFREYNQLWWTLEDGCWKMRQGVWGTLCQPSPLSESKSVTWCFMPRGECESANTKGKIFLWGV